MLSADPEAKNVPSQLKLTELTQSNSEDKFLSHKSRLSEKLLLEWRSSSDSNRLLFLRSSILTVLSQEAYAKRLSSGLKLNESTLSAKVI